MAREVFPHYICDYCEKEVVEKTPYDMGSWITIATISGSRYDDESRIILTYMQEGWSDEDRNGYENALISENLYFCCKECLIKYLLKHLKEKVEVPSFVTNPKKENGESKQKTRFEVIDS